MKSRKRGPALVMNADSIGRLRLRIVVPITEWNPAYARHVWFVRLIPTPGNGLTKESGADAFQVKSVAVTLTTAEMDDIAKAIAVCVRVP
jgi:mRNA interferase MazF